MAIEYGASALGFVSAMPSGPGIIAESLIAEIALQIPPPIATFLLTSARDSREIIEQVKRCRTNTIQICDSLQKGSYQEIREALPSVSIVQVLHVTTEAVSLAEAIAIAPHIDAILLDSGNPNLSRKELGGTGRVHDWEISAQIRDRLNIPIFLAGGLNPDNVALAIERVAPFGLDVCSGVRSNGKLDEAKLKQFLDEAIKSRLAIKY
jgi:phosphoribosylanthranilate isomerase